MAYFSRSNRKTIMDSENVEEEKLMKSTYLHF